MQTDHVPLSNLEVVVHHCGTTRTVVARGEIDISTVDLLRRALSEPSPGGVETVVLDLGETTFIESAGVALIVGTSRRAVRSGLRFIILPGPPAITRLFDICGLTVLLPFAREVSGDPPLVG
jgi:anti-anti-sigma factor